jgi:hypothetical protein
MNATASIANKPPPAIHAQVFAVVGPIVAAALDDRAAAADQFVIPLTEELVSVSSAVRNSRAVW